MVSSSSCQIHVTAANTAFTKLISPQRRKPQLGLNHSNASFRKCCSHVSASWQCQQAQVVIKSLPVVASVAVLLWSSPASAGFLSGITGIESVPGPELPKVEFLDKFNGDKNFNHIPKPKQAFVNISISETIPIVASFAAENQKQYAEFDKRFNESPLLKKLLEKSKLNKEKNKQAIQDKYCLRGAEWGVGDCSAEGMTEEEKDKFIAMLKAKVGEE